MSLRKIDLQECHQHLLQIAQCFDILCTKHQIPYFMLGGTMLGAIRHKGFIPWDDDMDFGIPRPYFQKFIEIAQIELPNRYEVLTKKNASAIKKGFIKIQLKGSKVIEKVFESENKDFYNGISIDIFPLDGVKKDSFIDKLHDKYIFFLIRIHEGQFCSLSIRKGLKKIIAAIIKGLPIHEKRLADYIDKLIQLKKYEECDYVANYYGHWKEKETINKKIFGQCKRYPFETLSLKGVEQWDNYLTALYGNYMQLPPKEQQITHADDIYIKDKNTHIF